MDHHTRNLRMIQETKDTRIMTVPLVDEARLVSKALKKRKEELKRSHDFQTAERNSQINRNN